MAEQMNKDNIQLLQQLIEEHRALGISEQIDYQKFYLYSIITHSTAIEGSTVTEVETQLLFDEGITSSKRSIVEMNMNLDLRDAYLYGMQWIKRHEDITVQSLIDLSARVMARTGSEYHSMAGDFSAAKGELRLLNVSAGFGGRSYMSYLKVPAKLQEFCTELNERRKKIDRNDVAAIYELSFWAHFELVTIHPWADGNGRMSRLLMNLLQFEFDVLPSKVRKEDKAEYIQALVDSRDEDDIMIFIDCMARLHCQNMKCDIEQFRMSMEDEKVDRKGGQKTQKVDRKGGQKTKETLLSLIESNPKVTSTEMASTLGINRSAVAKHLKQMQEANVIRRVGADKGGHWEVVTLS